MSRIAKVESYILTVPRDEPYLGALRAGEEPNRRGYFVRKGNKTVYPSVDRSVLVRVETEDGVVGWGETYGIVAPKATTAIVEDLLTEFVIGRDPFDASEIHNDLYNLMRVRGYGGGFYLDALGAVDIALWDAAGRTAGKPIYELLGGRKQEKVPGYVSGLPKRTLEERAAFAKEWLDRGFDKFKFAAPVADEGIVREMEKLREVLGNEASISCDMHWAHTPDGAIAAIKEMEPYGLWFAEAPIATEDVKGLGRVAHSVDTPIGAGEEWRTLYEARLRYDANAVHIVQPEMGHTGITEFVRISKAAHERGIQILPHATIGSGIFLAASLQASFALKGIIGHEYQHSIVERNHNLITKGIGCSDGLYFLSDTGGLGIEPTEEMISRLERQYA
tara:strand:- start:138 stop:1310 length:1173 start_codon:yes stop_codon:yes gene_type:complete